MFNLTDLLAQANHEAQADADALALGVLSAVNTELILVALAMVTKDNSAAAALTIIDRVFESAALQVAQSDRFNYIEDEVPLAVETLKKIYVDSFSQYHKHFQGGGNL